MCLKQTQLAHRATSRPHAGGETRLVSLPFHSDYQGLLEALERTCAPLGGAGGSSDSASDAAPRTFVSFFCRRLTRHTWRAGLSEGCGGPHIGVLC